MPQLRIKMMFCFILLILGFCVDESVSSDTCIQNSDCETPFFFCNNDNECEHKSILPIECKLFNIDIICKIVVLISSELYLNCLS